jgi:hypothetical protein
MLILNRKNQQTSISSVGEGVILATGAGVIARLFFLITPLVIFRK